jgi:hypothetical protein
MHEVMCEVIDGKINTPEIAHEIFEHEVREYATELKITEQGARALLIRSLLRISERSTPKLHDQLIELFNLPKPEETPIEELPGNEMP